MSNDSDWLVVLRYIGSTVVIIGHFVLLNVNHTWGLVLRVGANCMLIPFAVKMHYWDVVIIDFIFLGIDIQSVITSLPS